MQHKPQSSIVLLMIFMAIIMGIGGFLIVTYLAQRPDTPEGETAGRDGIFTEVQGVPVQVDLDPNKTVEIVGLGGVQPAVQPALDQPTAPPLVAVQTGDSATADPPTAEPLPTATFVPPTATPVPDKVILIDYLVPADGSLYQVSSRMDTSIALMSVYNVSAEDLVPGATIRLPVGNPAYCPGRRPYAVGEGDTAFSIGRRFGISAEQLQAINNLDASFTVKVADILCVP